MSKTSIIHTTVNRSGTFMGEESLLKGLHANTSSAFSALYDQYASVILGVITKIVRDEHESTRLLEVTFTKVRSQIGEFQATKQPFFTWLLSVARHTAIDAVKKRKSLKPSGFQLTTSEKIIPDFQSNTTSVLANSLIQSVDLQSKELLDKVLFGNCTPEEAATSLGLPIDSARQQLRLAMQRLRASQQFD